MTLLTTPSTASPRLGLMVSYFLFAGSKRTPLASLKKNFMVQAASTHAIKSQRLQRILRSHLPDVEHHPAVDYDLVFAAVERVISDPDYRLRHVAPFHLLAFAERIIPDALDICCSADVRFEPTITLASTQQPSQ